MIKLHRSKFDIRHSLFIRLRRRPRLLAVDECEKDNPPRHCAQEGMLQRIPPKKWRYHGLCPWGSISPERLQRIRQRKKNGKWNSRSQFINNVREDFQNIRCLAGLAEFTLHDLRRSAITDWSQRLPIQVVQKLAGHSDMNTTEQYYLAVREGDILSANHVLKGFLDQTEDD